VLAAGGSATVAGYRALRLLEAALLCHNASPGGSADLLAGAMLLDSLDNAAHDGEHVPEEVA
jgi:triphosphoribosyl-dephospho-CoA synthase